MLPGLILLVITYIIGADAMFARRANGNLSSSYTSIKPSSQSSAPILRSCLMSFGSSGPVDTSGYTVLSGSGSPLTVPCSAIVDWEYNVIKSAGESDASASSVASRSSVLAAKNSRISLDMISRSSAWASITASAQIRPGCYQSPNNSGSFNPSAMTVIYSGNVDRFSATTVGCLSWLASYSSQTSKSSAWLSAIGLTPPEQTSLYSAVDMWYSECKDTGLAHNTTNSQACSSYLSFRKSPECTSIAQAANIYHDAPVPEGVIPVNIFHDWGTCCAGCILRAPYANVYHWPTAPPRSQSHTEPYLATLGSTAIIDGFTFTSPSIYLALKGTVSVYDSCGVLGNSYVDPTVAVRPGGLSTYASIRPTNNVATFWAQPYEFTDLALSCYSNNSLTAFDSLPYQTSIGTASGSNGCAPVLVPPSELLNLDPAWRTCTWLDGNFLDYLAFDIGVRDPPHLLTPLPVMAGPMTTAASAIGPSPATVFQTPTLPPQTASVVLPLQSRKPSNSFHDPQHPSISTGTSFKNAQDPSTITVEPLPASTSQATIDPDPAQAVEKSLSLDQSRSKSEPVSTVDSTPLGNFVQSIQQPTNHGLGAMIMSAFGITPTTLRPQPGPQDTPQLEITQQNDQGRSRSGSLIFSGVTSSSVKAGGDPAVISIAGFSITQGGPGITISGVAISVASHDLLIGSSTIALSTWPSLTLNLDGHTLIAAKPYETIAGGPGKGPEWSYDPSLPNSASESSHKAPLATQTIFTVGGQTTVADLSAISIDGTTLSPGGHALTLGGSRISMDSFGGLIIGSSTLVLPSPSLFTIGGIMFTANPTRSAIAGKTLTAGDPASVVTGMPLSVEGSATLVFGPSSSTLSNLATSAESFTSAGRVYTEEMIYLRMTLITLLICALCNA